jgi:hypothetical protein
VPLVGKPVANIDLAPTILDLTGAKPCGEQEVPDHGRTLADAAADAIGPLAARSGC